MPKPPESRKQIKDSRVQLTKFPKPKGKGKAKQTLTAEQLFGRAQQALVFEQFDAALECMRDALQLEPENTEVLDAYGALLAELGRVDEAVQELQKAVQLSPDNGFEKYMYLGQLLKGEQALAAAHKGVELLQQEVEHSKQTGDISEPLIKQLAAALCSLAEMKMSQAGNLSVVAADAEALLQQAQSTDPASPEPLQALASLRYEQGLAEEALQLLRQSMALWFKPHKQSEDENEEEETEEADNDAQVDASEIKIPKKPVTMSEEMELENAQEEEEYQSNDEEKDDCMPSYEFRFESAKMLLELEDTTETAIQVLEDLIAENDGVPDVWHLLGLSYYSGGMLTEAAEVCEAGIKVLQKQQMGPDEDIAALFHDLRSAIQEAQTVN